MWQRIPYKWKYWRTSTRASGGISDFGPYSFIDGTLTHVAKQDLFLQKSSPKVSLLWICRPMGLSPVKGLASFSVVVKKYNTGSDIVSTRELTWSQGKLGQKCFSTYHQYSMPRQCDSPTADIFVEPLYFTTLNPLFMVKLCSVH